MSTTLEARLEGALAFSAPYVVDRLLKDRVVDTPGDLTDDEKVGERDDAADRAEDLFADQPHIGCGVGDDRRLVEETLAPIELCCPATVLGSRSR